MGSGSGVAAALLLGHVRLVHLGVHGVAHQVALAHALAVLGLELGHGLVRVRVRVRVRG